MGALDAGPGRTVLIGRRDECRLLRELLDAVRADDSRSLNLLGERGMGKTALLEYAAGAARDVRVERTSGVESEMGLAFATLHQLCAQMLDRVERLPEPQGRALATAFGLISGSARDHFLVGLAVLGLLAETAADRPLLCVIDDVQWIDEASAHTLAFVARRVSAEPLGFLFAARQLRAELHGLPTLRLGGLDDHARASAAAVGRRQPAGRGGARSGDRRDAREPLVVAGSAGRRGHDGARGTARGRGGAPADRSH